MKRALILIAFVFLALQGSRTLAQESFTNYDNAYSGEKYNVRITLKHRANFALWIDAMPFDVSLPKGGLIIREKFYYKFLDALEAAKHDYLSLTKTAMDNNVRRFMKPMKINFNTDVYFLAGNWHIQQNVSLDFDFKVIEKDGVVKYWLFITTGELRSEATPSVKSDGYGLAFSSIEDIDRFIESISTQKINEYFERKGKSAFLIKNDDKSNNSNIHYPQVGFGIKAGYSYSGEMNNLNSSKIVSYSAKTVISDLPSCFSVGFFSRLDFKNLYFQPEILYSFGKKSYIITMYDLKYQNVELAKDVSISMLDIPLLAGYKLVHSKDMNLRVYVGPKFRLDAGSIITYPRLVYQNIRAERTFTKENLSTNPSALGLGLDAGLEFDIYNLTFDTRYSFIGDTYSTRIGTYTIDKTTANALVFSIGWKLFRLKN